MNLAKAYQPQDYEDGIYQKWLDSGYFNPDNLPFETDEHYSIMMPPPNATGVLHLGHASMLAIEDTMIRYNRLLGKKTLWLPGTDHAAIATQTKVEKIIAEEGETRHSLGREKFLERVREYVGKTQDTIRNQIKKVGASCDWSREAYTLDDNLSYAVKEIFIKMYEDNLVYRGPRIVNWCPRCGSTLADDEVEYKEENTKLYYFKYNKDFPFVISTTRPETKLGDTAIAVHPDDERFKEYIGKEIETNFLGIDLKLKVIADEEVDPEFGTGVLGVTPAHSVVDYEMKEKHNLRTIEVIDQEGNIKDGFAEFSGLSAVEARALIVKRLDEAGLLEKTEDVQHNISVCYRCGTAIEPLISTQWFVDVNKEIPRRENKTLKELALEAVNGGLLGDKKKEIQIIPERFVKTYNHWMENLRPWCISRQIWWGHRIPVFYCDDCGEVIVSHDSPELCNKCNSKNIRQDEDTLDTWFSSGLWTFSPLGWPDENSVDLKNYHPTDVLETGYDILFFWIARMILMTTYALGEIPFKIAYLHGMVRDKEGRKMSKSLGNGIDPLDMSKKYGTDALRLSLILGNSPGSDIPMYAEKVEGYRNFVNKLWNISRFVLSKIENPHYVSERPKAKTLSDKWLFAKLDELKENYFLQMDKYNLAIAGDALRVFAGDIFADWYLEIAKIEEGKDEILLYILRNLLQLWHPFIPFVTEVIWENFNAEDLLLVSVFDKFEKLESPDVVFKDFELLQNVVSSIRNIKNEYKINSRDLVVSYKTEKSKIIEENKEIIIQLAKIKELNLIEKEAVGSVKKVLDGLELFVQLNDLIDPEKEKERLSKEIEKFQKLLKTVEGKLNNTEFIDNAPEIVVNKEKEKQLQYQEKLEKMGMELGKL